MGVLDDKVAIVTGSARGIGRATAELLSSQGAKVLINDLDADVARQTAGEIAGETVVYGGDLTADGAPDELVKTAVDAFGQVDIIVNNAGYTLDAPIHKMSDDWWEKMLGIPDQLRGMAAMLIPLGRPGTPEEAAGGVFFLCSPWSNYVHGQVLNVTGGQFTGMTT